MTDELFQQQFSKLSDLTIDKISVLYRSSLPNNYHNIITECTNEVYDPLYHCLKYTTHNRKFFEPVNLNPLHTGHFCIFLYLLSRSLNARAQFNLADIIFATNKMMHSIDMYYQVNLPKVFHLEHPVGSVIGKASFGNFLYIGQNCTVGRNMSPKSSSYPSFGKRIMLTSNVTIVGDSKIGSNVIFSSGCFVKDASIPDNCIVFGRSPKLIIKPLAKATALNYFRQMFYINS